MEPSKCAALVIDMQNDFCHKDGVWARHGLYIHGLERIVGQLIGAIDFFKNHHIPVIYIQEIIIEGPKGEALTAGSLVPLRPFLNKEGLRPGSWGVRFIEDLPTPEYKIGKLSYSGFYQTYLDSLLRALGVRYLFIGGISTNVCVDCTARDAVTRGFQVFLMKDCLGSFDRERHEAALKSTEGLMEIITSEELKALF